MRCIAAELEGIFELTMCYTVVTVNNASLSERGIDEAQAADLRTQLIIFIEE